MKIAISGHMCSGKTTIANIIKNQILNYQIYSFGKKVKDVAYDLFNMDKSIKNRSLLINIADKMREIDEDVWAKHVIHQISDKNNCIIDDLRFQNELDILEKDGDWIYIVLTIDNDIRLERLKQLYPDNYSDHIKNMGHLSEQCDLHFYNKKRVLFLNTNNSLDNIKYNVKYFINQFN